MDPSTDPALPPRRHVLSIDDGPFEKFVDRDALIVGVVTAGKDLVEGVLTTRLPIDVEEATERLSEWVNGSRFRPVLRAIILNGITIAGLSVIDLPKLSRLTGLPVISVNRRPPENEDLANALRTAGFPGRIPLLDRAGPSHPFGPVHLSAVGMDLEGAKGILRAEAGRSHLPEGIRLAHIIAQGIVLGESKGRP